MMSGSSSSGSSSTSRWTYEVFLSFRGADTRMNFVDLLYNALVQAGIDTFCDDGEFARGEKTSEQLRMAIQQSRIAILVLSRGYASSRWCLDELVEILASKHRNTGQIVIPISYDVDPSDVGELTRSFQERFNKHEERFKEKVNQWKEALVEVGNLSCFSLHGKPNRSEIEIAGEIVNDVKHKLDRKLLNVATSPAVGIESRVNRVLDLLVMGANDVRIVGIHGIAGIGKTTIAKAVFNKVYHEFKGSCFLANIKEISERPNGSVQLQEQFLSDITGWDYIGKIDDVDRGINLIKELVGHKKVLLVLDDVDQRKQLDALMAGRSSFGPGSRIVITTRDGSLLDQLQVDVKYLVEELDPIESLQLFSWHAFGQSRPVPNFEELSKAAAAYAIGLPLALVILGSRLFGRSMDEWQSEIAKLQNIPRDQIQRKYEKRSKVQKGALDPVAYLKDHTVQDENFVASQSKPLKAEQPHEESAFSHFDDQKEANQIDISGKRLMLAPQKIEEWESSAKIHLTDYELPENPTCPMLQSLSLEGNSKLTKIPPFFFNQMPALQVLNLSSTPIKYLPESLFRLKNLKKLFLNNCLLLMILSPSIGKLEHLEVLDLEGTKILELPKEVGDLKNLTCLKVSFCEPTSSRRSLEQPNVVIPRGTLSALSHLEELKIDVSPEDERWNVRAREIVSELSQLRFLTTLKLYLPEVELPSLFTSFSIPIMLPALSHFRFTVGRHAQQIISRLPRDAELKMESYDRCLKYIHGESIPEDIKMVLRHATAFFLSRHANVNRLSDFGLGNMKQLRCCVLGECNKLQIIGDGDDVIMGSGDDVLQSLEYLYVYYMKNLKSIWTGPLLNPTLRCLKFLTLSTCPQLETLFTPALLENLCGLEQLTVDDCPMITSLVSYKDPEDVDVDFLPNLKRMSLHFLPDLTSIAGGLRISARLEWMSFYYCPNLRNLPISKEFNGDLQGIEGEESWWTALEWESDQQHCWDDIFFAVDI